MTISFEDAINTLAKRALSLVPSLSTEEATKTALVLPFLQALGYDVFDPNTVVPEFNADHGIKKAEKVDYAIKLSGELRVLIECKSAGVNLDSIGGSQLFRYFSVTPAKVAILTNGIEYRFFSDLDSENKMDERPFFIFDFRDLSSAVISELAKFRANQFAIDSILATANDLRYLSLIKQEVSRELDTPSAEFVELFLRRVYAGKLTSSVRDWLSAIALRAVSQVLREKVNRRLNDAILPTESRPQVAAEPVINSDGDVETTESEREAFLVVRAICRQVVQVNRIVLRDAKSYCAILLDDNNRRPICRLYFGPKSNKIGIFSKKVETKLDLNSVDDIYNYARELQAAVKDYD